MAQQSTDLANIQKNGSGNSEAVLNSFALLPSKPGLMSSFGHGQAITSG